MTRRRMLLVAGALIALGVALLWWPWPRGAGPAASTPTPGSRRAGPEPGRARAVDPGAAAPAAAPAAPMAMSPAIAVPAADAPTGELAGRVLNWGNGAPVAGAEVTVAPIGGGAASSFVTDANGSFVARTDALGRHRLVSALAAGFLPWAPDPDRSPLELEARAGVRIEGVVLYLVPALTYHGRVVDPDGAPVVGATVVMLDAASGERAAAPIEDTFTSGADGRFDFHSPDGALLEARAAGFAPGRARLDGAAQTSHELTIQLGARGGSAPAALAIGGTVVDPAGAPVAGARVVASAAAELGVGGEAISDADGRFTIGGLDPGGHGLRAHAEGYASTSVAVEAGATDVVLALVTGARLIGRVVDPGGAAIAAPTVVVQRRTGLVARAVTVVSIFDAQGRFAIDGLVAGSYEVIAQAAGFAPSAPVTAVAARDPDELTVTVRTGATVTGTMIDGDTRAPLASGKVSVEGALGEGSSAVPLVTAAITAADGSFELTGIAPGRRSLTAGAYAHHLAIVGPLDVAEGARLGPITIELSPTAPGEEPRLELAGIGARLAAVGDVLRVEGVIPGGGAEAAGLAAGDLLLAVDGTAIAALGMDGSIQRIRGPVGSVVRLTVQRGEEPPRELPVTRTKIRA